jgi:hypothetical protein
MSTVPKVAEREVLPTQRPLRVGSGRRLSSSSKAPSQSGAVVDQQFLDCGRAGETAYGSAGDPELIRDRSD